MTETRTHFIKERIEQLWEGDQKALDEIYAHVEDVMTSHSSLIHTYHGNPDDPTGSRESCYAVAEEAVRRYRELHALGEPAMR